MYQKKLQPDIRCPLEYGLDIFVGKWKSRIICVLASTLKELIADEMVLRKSYDEIPPRVEYSLPRKGRSVVPILQNICRWADKYYQEECDYNLTPCQRCVYK